MSKESRQGDNTYSTLQLPKIHLGQHCHLCSQGLQSCFISKMRTRRKLINILIIQIKELNGEFVNRPQIKG